MRTRHVSLFASVAVLATVSLIALTPSAVTQSVSGPDTKIKNGGATLQITSAGKLSFTNPASVTAFAPTGQGLACVFADDYCLKDGTDQSANWATMVAALVARGGGTIYLGPGTIRLNSAWILTYAGSPPRQVPIIVQGMGADVTGGTWLGPTSGSILDLRYDAAGEVAKIDSRGVGMLVLRDLTLKDGSVSAANGTPFVKVTNTNLYCERVNFRGCTAGTGANQDAIVFGGTDTGSFGGSAATQPFQGYGTVVKGCFFTQVRRGLYLRAFANAIMAESNTWGTNCGGVSAIELDGLGDSCVGNYFGSNLIELTNYTYGVKATKATGNSFVGNMYYDPGVGMTAVYRMDTGASYNRIFDGFNPGDPGTGTDFSETASVVDTNLFITANQNGTNRLPYNTRFLQPGNAPNVVVKNSAGTTVWLPRTLNNAGDVWDQATNYASGTGFGHRYNYFTPSGGAQETITDLWRVSSTQARFNIGGTGGGRVENQNGDFYSLSGPGNTYWFGNGTAGTLATVATMTGGILSVPQLTARSQRPTYGATVTVDPASGAHMRIEVTDANNFTIANPANATAGQTIIVVVNNRSGGAMGTITWGDRYLMSGWVNPADTKTRTVMFVYDSFRNYWEQVGSVSPDI